MYPTSGWAPAAPVAGAAAVEEEEGEGWYFSMSDLMIRPPGPVPLICFRGTPRSRARRRAMGEAAMGPPKSRVGESSLGVEGFFSGCFCCFCSSLGGSSFGGGAGSDSPSSAEGLGADFLPPASSIVKSLNASTEDSSSTITAIGYKRLVRT